MAYVELHAHSAFSFLDGASLPEELALAAVERGHEAMALVDHDSVCGSMEWAVAAQATGLRALHGAELSLDDGRHLTLLVEDARGWANLCRLVTISHSRTRDGRPGPRRRRPREGAVRSTVPLPASLPATPRSAPRAEPHVALEAVLSHSEGLICLTGCASHGVQDAATGRLLLEAFGRDGLRVELQRPFLPGDRARNRARSELARRLGVPTVATGNVHAHARTRAPLQDAFAAIRLHETLDASEPRRRGNWSHVLASPAAMAARFPDHPDAVAETARLADRLRFDLRAGLGYHYPGSEDEAAGAQLAARCRDALEARYGRGPDHNAALARLEEELRVIETLGLAGFFLLHHDMVELAREVAVEVRGPDSARGVLPPARGRGSSVSSIVCYLIGLSHVDPIRNKLFLGRFLNEELSSLPDIDLDFPRDIRERLIPRVHERYGRDRSALVAAFPTYRARGAIRELGKALGLPPGEVERVARGSEGWSARDVGRDVAAALGERRARTGRWPWLVRLAGEAHGLPRHLSQHSGGMIVATRPLVDCCPIVPAAMEGRQVVQWDKDSCADAGFLKIDLLGLGMLSAVERCVDTIARTRGERIDLSRIPYDDPATYDAIQKAETTGVFQIESRAQMASLVRTRPETLDDITVQVAIVRPGPIQGGAVNPYIERRQRRRADPGYEVPHEHPSLEPVLRDTLGTIIFQDQVLEVAVAFAGFTPGEAEGLRRAMSRKRSEAAIAAHRERFVAGAEATHGADRETAERVWGMVEGFSGFGFPKAHGAAFGLLAYQSTWLRVHHPAEFLCALLNEQPMGFYVPDTLVHEAQRRGVEVLAPDVEVSDAECTTEAVAVDRDIGGKVQPHAVRIGLGFVNGVRREEIEALVAARAARGGRFGSLAELAASAGAGRPSLERLAWSGACDALAGGDRRAALWGIGVTATAERASAATHTQLALSLEVPVAPSLRGLTPWQRMLADYSSTGMTAGEHPLALLRRGLPPGVAASRDLPSLRHRSRVRVGGLVVARQRPGTANGIVFLLLEDEHGTINLIVGPEVYERHRLTVRTEPLVLASGRLERHPAAGGAINVLVDRLDPIETPDLERAEVRELTQPQPAEIPDSEEADGDFRAVAPAVMSFGSGRRR
ncbi:MAG: error-prone polymerase [Solirubrobacteraceae bacterium]|jgi:error-prone DNA polymerase|nr:error-prone polymerase [Solirubrobacteraceae bacterium]